jgi:hypothetical protein
MDQPNAALVAVRARANAIRNTLAQHLDAPLRMDGDPNW